MPIAVSELEEMHYKRWISYWKHNAVHKYNKANVSCVLCCDVDTWSNLILYSDHMQHSGTKEELNVEKLLLQMTSLLVRKRHI